MSLQFQNDCGDSVKQAIIEELQNLMSPNTNVLKQAEKRIKQLQFTEGYGVYLSEIIMNQSHELPLRQLAISVLTRYVEDHWTEITESGCKSESVVSEQAKRTIRNILPNGLYDPNARIRSAVAKTISTIAATDYPNGWVELFDIIVKCLGGNEDSIHGAMQVLQDFSYDADQIKELGPVVIQVYRIFESEQSYSIKTRVAAIRILNPLFLSIQSVISEKQEQNTMINSILTNFMDKLMHYLSMNSGSGSNFLMRSEIAKVFSYLVVQMPNYVCPFMDRIMPIIWQLLTQVADTYVKVIVNKTEENPLPCGDDDDDDEQDNFQKMIIQIMEFINCIATSSKLRGYITNVMADLVYIIIVYIQLPEEQIEYWQEDQEKYVDDEEDGGGNELTVRMCGRDVLVAINEEFESKAIQPLQEALRRHFTVADAEKSAGNVHWWKIHEACMDAVHGFHEIILKGDTTFDLLNYLTIVRNLLVHQEAPHLVGRALWTLSTYSKSDLYNTQMLAEILDVTLCCLSPEKSHILRISAVRALDGFLQANETIEGEKRTLLVSKLPGFLDGIMALVPGSRASVLALLMDALTTMVKFDGEFACAGNAKIAPLTIAVFLKYTDDPFVLANVQDLIKALCQRKESLLPLQEKFLPTIVSILALQGKQAKDQQDIALDVLATLVRYSEPPLSDVLLETAFPALINCVLRSDDHSVMVAAGDCLRCFINVSPEQICSYKNGEGVNYVMQVVTVLLNPMNSEMTAGEIGRLVITIITKMGNMLGQNIDMLLKAVISKLQLVECLKVIMSLVVIFAHLILTSMDAVLNFLATVPGPTGEPAMQFVLGKWLSRQNCFYGAYENRVTLLALCKLFEYGMTTQDNRLTLITYQEQVETSNDDRPRTRSTSAAAQKWIAIPALVKVFKVLLSEYQHLQENKSANAASDEDNTDDEDSGGDNHNPQRISDLYFDQEDSTPEDDQLLEELLKSNQGDIVENLHKFILNFTQNEHFPMFYEQLNDAERRILTKVQQGH